MRSKSHCKCFANSRGFGRAARRSRLNDDASDEDEDGDGIAEKTTVFADGLLIPTGIAPGDGGAYVANSTDLIHLQCQLQGRQPHRALLLLFGRPAGADLLKKEHIGRKLHHIRGQSLDAL